MTNALCTSGLQHGSVVAALNITSHVLFKGDITRSVNGMLCFCIGWPGITLVLKWRCLVTTQPGIKIDTFGSSPWSSMEMCWWHAPVPWGDTLVPHKDVNGPSWFGRDLKGIHQRMDVRLTSN